MWRGDSLVIEPKVYNIGSGYGNRGADLLWENNDPYSSFHDQTIQIDNLSKYLMLLVITKSDANSETYHSERSILTVSSEKQYITSFTHGSYRVVSILNNSIHFSLSTWTFEGAPEEPWIDQAGYAVPVRIYGIR